MPSSAGFLIKIKKAYQQYNELGRIMKRVLLIRTAELYCKNENPQAVPHGGLGYLASILQARGFEVFLLDVLAEGFENKLWLDSEWFRVGLSRKELRQKIKQINPDFVGISAMFSSQHEMLEETVEDVRLATVAPIIVGGVHATFMPDLVLGIKGVDYVLRGEAEESLPMLLENKSLSNIPGLSFIQSGKIVHNLHDHNPDIRKLPFPAREIYPGASSIGDLYSKLNAPHGHKFNEKNLPYYEIVTSRGCNYKCAGCAGSRFAGRNRTREASDVLNEIDLLIKKFGMKSLVFIDDNFIQDKNRAIFILQEIIKRRYNLNLTFPNGLLIRNLFINDGKVDEKFIDLLRTAGTSEVDLPIETAIPRIMKAYLSQKYDTKLDLGNLCKSLAARRIKVSGYFMIGFPREAREEMESTIELAQRLENCGMHNAWFFLVGAFPGSVFWKEKNISKTELRNLRFRRASGLVNENFLETELSELLNEAQKRVDKGRT